MRGDRHAHDLAPLPYRQNLGVLRLQRLAPAGQQLVHDELAGARDLGDEIEELVALVHRSARAHALAHAVERGSEARLIHGLQQIVHRARLEGANGVLVVRGDEHHQRHGFLRQLREHFETRHARHLDIEEHQVRLVGRDGRDGFAAVRALGNDLEILRCQQPDFQPAPGERFVVDDDRADLLAHATLDPMQLAFLRSRGCRRRRRLLERKADFDAHARMAVEHRKAMRARHTALPGARACCAGRRRGPRSARCRRAGPGHRR